ncbi:MAG: hybrid sensor histidine kinase/response regulator [Methanoregula sp.]|nr:hybrid sensor histidine kinase/response regulator [Methanoregula sp.]
MPCILIADDNPQNLYLLEAILKGIRFDVVSAGNGAEALDAALQNPPDLIIADILMPVMDGFELCRKWRRDGRLKRIPFIFYTATYTDPKDERFALGLGADRFIIKPQKPEILGRIVCDLLEEYRKGTPDAHKELPGDEMEILRQYNEVLFHKLGKKMKDLEEEVSQHRKAEERTSLANRKLALMTDVTYQDIQNKITALTGYVNLSRKPADEKEHASFIEKELEILNTIHLLIKKTKDYQRMGMDKSRWMSLEQIIRMQMSLQSQKNNVTLSCDLPGLEIRADPLIDHVFNNLIHNAIHHGRKITGLSFYYRETRNGLVVTCEDDGVGIPSDQKPHIFDRVAGGEGKFGLFFVRECLALSGMTIRETGIPGNGARFEITVPAGMYRFAGPR